MSLLLFFDHPYPAYAPVIGRNILQDPVDCVLAGNQDDEQGKSVLDTRRGHAHYRALRGIFRE